MEQEATGIRIIIKRIPRQPTQGTSDKVAQAAVPETANKNNATNYGNTDYGADSDGVTDYDNEQYRLRRQRIYKL